ncbi:MAG: GTP-binding protein, partial [Candidatus Helarchaeota archaeon]|nr:GTP-binding protein [Candidatus Helarchaeota archaeon]
GDKGPDAFSWYPAKMDNLMLTEVSIKAISILAGEAGELPEHLSVLPLPKFHLTALIHVFEIHDEKARGGAIVAAISVLFDEKYTPFVYKCMEGLEKSIKPMSKLAEPIKNSQNITEFLKELFDELKSFIGICQTDEVTRYQIEGQVKKEYSQKYAFKIIVIGDPGVGKTTLLLRFVDKAFRELYIPTVGVQVSVKHIEVASDTQAKLNIWDVAGQEHFKSLRRNFYQGSNAVLIVYDITNPKTFKNVETWYLDMVKVLGPIPGFLVGNKADLRRQVSKLDGQEQATRMKLGGFIETSAKTGENIDNVFQSLALMLINAK